MGRGLRDLAHAATVLVPHNEATIPLSSDLVLEVYASGFPHSRRSPITVSSTPYTDTRLPCSEMSRLSEPRFDPSSGPSLCVSPISPQSRLSPR